MLRAIAAAKKKNAVTSYRSATWHPPPFAIDAEPCATATCWRQMVQMKNRISGLLM
jgi:hypothetical protein